MPKGYKIEGQVIIPTNSKYQVQLIVEGNATKPTITDDDKMYFTNETTKAAVRDYIKQSVDKKDKTWVENFDRGIMTRGDFEGLKIIISQG
ncbi:hypothetical protein AABM34_13660 [Lysinibacillus fusiformis]